VHRDAFSVHGEHKSIITSISRDTKTLYGCSKLDAEQCITELVESDPAASLQSKAESEAYHANIALKTKTAGRNIDRKAQSGTYVQKFLCTLGDFLQSISGIAEIVKAAASSLAA
jgi:hypothetical protein